MDESFAISPVKFGQICANSVRDCDSTVIQNLNVIAMPKQQRASRGTVAVHCFKGRLRLVWSFCGKRYFFLLGLPDTKANRAIADLQAKVIERDLVNRLFDPTLRKYRGDWVEVRLTVESKGARDVGAAAAIDADKPGAFLRIYGWSNQKLWWERPRQGD